MMWLIFEYEFAGDRRLFYKGAFVVRDSGERRRSYFWPGLFWTLVLTLFLISFAVVFVLYMKPFYYIDIKAMKLNRATGLGADVIRRNYDAMVDYMHFWNHQPLVLPDFVMSEHGRIHFADCKVIFDAVQYICIVTGILTIVSIIVHHHSLHYRYLRAAGILTLVLPVGLGVLSYLNWDKVFITFHKIFFRNNYWIFDPNTDPVIRILPDAFFLQCVVIIAAVLIIGAIILFIRAARKKRRLRDRVTRSRVRGRRRQ